MRIDMHIHTNRYSSCSHIDPYKLIIKAKRKGLDGIVITEHERLWRKEEIAELKKFSGNLVILRGVEVSTPQGLHLLIYGLNEDLEPGMDEVDIIREAHKHSAVVIPAHPYRYGAGLEELLYSLEIDGLEIMSTNTSEMAGIQAQLLRDKLNIPGIAGSDAHDIRLVGAYYTEFQCNITNEAELVEAIRRHTPLSPLNRGDSPPVCSPLKRGGGGCVSFPGGI
ncbi:MAG TPA: CehA/McbA family metallohydrolase [Candidatus Brocadiia bacterium]|nr:PHP domain-containing protein [Planctomycetota bacterium]MDO8093877.1 CehA/McbA family metallohydrolase [Candidatus Brocadiales bacterium]